MKPDRLDIEVAAAILRDNARLIGHPATAGRFNRVADWLMSEIEAGVKP